MAEVTPDPGGAPPVTRALFVDPGETCGVCLVEVDRHEAWVCQAQMDELEEVMNGFLPVTHLIVERWFLYPGNRIAKFDDMPGPEAIGMVRSWANRHGLKMERIPAKLRLPYLRDVPDSLRGDHQRDAMAMALYWLHRNTKSRDSFPTTIRRGERS